MRTYLAVLASAALLALAGARPAHAQASTTTPGVGVPGTPSSLGTTGTLGINQPSTLGNSSSFNAAAGSTNLATPGTTTLGTPGTGFGSPTMPSTGTSPFGTSPSTSGTLSSPAPSVGGSPTTSTGTSVGGVPPTTGSPTTGTPTTGTPTTGSMLSPNGTTTP